MVTTVSARRRLRGLAVVLATLVGTALVGLPSAAAAQTLGRLGLLGPVYGVAALQAALARDPRPWLGRPLLVRGSVVVEPRDPDYDALGTIKVVSGPSLSETGRPWSGARLPLEGGLPDPLLARLREIPLAGRLFPRPQALDWAHPATYRLVVQAVPSPSGQGVAYYEGVLLDAAGPLSVYAGI